MDNGPWTIDKVDARPELRILIVMCGFAGVIAWDEKYRCSRETLEKMSAAVAHRGPDGEGFYQSLDGPISADRPQVSLAFRRLAILDPDPRSNQPFTDGRHWLVFNGEIYNFRELKKELSLLRQDYQWKTTGDTEVLLCAYAVWGEKCVERLNGMFAFAVWDAVEKSLFLARDRMGQKPLYTVAGFANESFPATELRMDQYGRFPVVAFASEPSSLLRLPWVDKTIDPSHLEEYLRTGRTRWTIYASLSMLPPAGFTTVRLASVNAGNCFDPNRSSGPEVDANCVEQTRLKVGVAVRRQLVADVPLGVLLSGGVDSSVIAACARQVGEVETFSIGFDDHRYDESDFAVAVSKHLGTKHHSFKVTPDAANDLPVIAGVFGTPFADSSALPVHYLCRESRKVVKVALGGDGGDELFGGYDRYRAMRLARRLGRFNSGLITALGRRSRGAHPKSKTAQLGRFLVSLSLTSADRYDSYLRLFDEQLLRTLCPQPAIFDARLFFARLFERFQVSRDDVQAALAVDRVTYLPDDLLTKVDRCSMLHGLEVRSPFMDHELVQFAAGLTTDQLLKGGPKRMLREAFADDLPGWVFKRKKMGFAVPIGDWFRGELRSMLRDTLFSSHAFGRSHFDMKVVERLVEEHESKRVDHSQRLYALLMLELWWDLQKF